MTQTLGPLSLPQSSGKPVSPELGQIHFDVLMGKTYVYDGTEWRPFDPNEVEHDASSKPTFGTGNLEWTHTPVASMVRGVLVHIAQNVKSSTVQQVSGVTYGGVAMRLVKEVNVSSRGLITVWFLGDGIPQGAQTVKATVTGAAKKGAYCHTQTAPGPLRTISQNANAKAKVMAAGVTSLRESGMAYGVISATLSPTLTTSGAEKLYEENLNTAEAPDFVQFDKYKRSVNGSSSSTEFAWSNAAETEYAAMATVVGLVRDFGLVTELPTRAGRGDRCTYLADAANGVAWELIHTGELVSYPWLKVGGPPLFAYSDTQRQLINDTGEVYKSLPTDPLSLTVPLGGDYDITVQAQIGPGSATIITGIISYAIGATEANDAWSAMGTSTDAFANAGDSVGGTRRHTGVAASAVIAEKVRNSPAVGTVNYLRRRIIVNPVRVG